MKIRASLRLPKEHGAWAMLYVPFSVGALVGSTSSFSPLRLLPLLLSATFVFTARQSFLDWLRSRRRGSPGAAARRMMLAYVGLGGIFGAPLVFFYHLVWLVPIAMLTALLLAFNGWQAVRQRDRTVTGELIAILGLTLTAPTTYYVSRGEWDNSGWLLWALCILYFASSVFYVKLRVHSLKGRHEEFRRRTWRRCALYHLFLIAALVPFAVTGSTNLFVLVAFAPVLVRTFWQLAKPAGQVSLKQVGVLEIVYSVTFLVFVTIGFRGL